VRDEEPGCFFRTAPARIADPRHRDRWVTFHEHPRVNSRKRCGAPAAQLLTDNGSAMKAGEAREGLARLGILHEWTLPACPEQNANQPPLGAVGRAAWR
jgi:transposase InsO family protein